MFSSSSFSWMKQFWYQVFDTNKDVINKNQQIYPVVRVPTSYWRKAFVAFQNIRNYSSTDDLMKVRKNTIFEKQYEISANWTVKLFVCIILVRRNKFNE